MHRDWRGGGIGEEGRAGATVDVCVKDSHPIWLGMWWGPEEVTLERETTAQL